MNIQTIEVLSIIGLYMLGCIILGIRSYRSGASASDYLMASREFKFFILFSAVFGANISAVTLIGIPGTSYHVGWITWAYFGTAWAWLSPLLFYTIGNRSWVLGKKYDIVTISELLGKRWESKGLQYFSAIFLLFYLIPYLMVGVIGGGRTLYGLTNGVIPYWAGSLVVTLVVCFYVFLGGMRGAAWVNALQTSIFLIGGIVIFFVIAYSLGGFGFATQTIADKYPELLNRSNMSWQRFFSYGIIVSLAVPVFPNVYSRLLTGKKPSELKKTVLLYPIAGLLIFILMAYAGMWGRIPIPGLKGATSDGILPMLLAKYAPAWIAGILGAAIFSALMSTLDSQLIAIGQIFLKDIIIPIRKSSALKQNDATIGRALVIFFAVIAFVGALIQPKSIINIIEWSFGGFACMFIPVVAALYWKRCGKIAVLGSIVVSQFLSIALPLGIVPKSMMYGMLPAFWAMVGGFITLVVLAYITPAQDRQFTKSFFSVFSTQSA
ncbi:MAG TPA: sodium:solute symporter family protein [Syntrophorhabdaceae bacterium]|mgnify:CR=1 FL=1|nr:sodium:solute symporter family protein [Syntrophorhabdaceae bacterium]